MFIIKTSPQPPTNGSNDSEHASANKVNGIVESSLSEEVGGCDLFNENSDENTALKNNIFDHNMKHAACENNFGSKVLAEEKNKDTKNNSEDNTNDMFSNNSVDDGKSTNYPINGKDIILPKNFWEKNWQQKNSLKVTWPDDFNIEFAKVYPHCVLSFKRHSCKLQKENVNYTEETVWFSAYAKCLHSSCSSFKFKVISRAMLPYYDTQVKVLLSSPYCHNDEKHRRFIKGEKRQALAAELRLENPSKKHLKLLHDVPDSVIKAGNLNGVPGKQVLRQISCEDNAKDDLDKDPRVFMRMLIEQYKEKWIGEHFSGYIQMYCEYPFYILLMAEAVLKYVIQSKLRPLFYI